MSDAPVPHASVSDAFVADQRALVSRLDAAVLANPGDTFSRDMAALARKTLDEAVSVTGWKPPEPDIRSPAQIHHDEAHGVHDVPPTAYDVDWRVAQEHEAGVATAAREYAAALRLPPDLGRAIVNDMLAADGDPDPIEVAAYLARMGRDYGKTLAEVQDLLNTANQKFEGGRIDATDLSAMALVQLSVWAAHTKRHAATRPPKLVETK
jgi:hypothetical protein